MDNEELLVPEIPESPTAILAKKANDITEQIINENDPDKLEDLTKLFRMNQRKKDIVRANRLSNVIEIIDDEVVNRLTTTPEVIRDENLIKYMDSAQKAVANITNDITQVPVIQINNQKNEINIGNSSGLNRESRMKVLEYVMSILKDSEVIDVEENEE